MKLDPHEILLKPLLTEKSTALRETANKICFVVHSQANKIEVKRAVEEVLKVKVESVNILNMMGKTKKTGRFVGKRPDWKKAVVTLREGEKLDIFEGT
ncbi:MAG: 50S ribosomal protein L23 [Nitrospiria bacterium]